MDLEYLVVGIARGNEEDFNEFFRQTCGGAFAFALSLLGDRIAAREAAAESYVRVAEYAKEFDTAMSAKIWHLEIVRNLCVNGLADGEIARIAANRRRDNLSILLGNALFNTSDDRGKIIAARIGAGLSKKDAASLLWYNYFSCAGEYKRGIKEALALSALYKEDAISFSEAEERLKKDFDAQTPDYLELALGERPTAFANINGRALAVGDQDSALPGESREETSRRLAGKAAAAGRKRLIATAAVAAVVLTAAAVFMIVYFAQRQRTLIQDPDDPYAEVTEPQYRTDVAAAFAGGRLYYGNYGDGGALYVYELESGRNIKISDAKPRDIEVRGDTVVFRDSSTGELCYIVQGEETEVRSFGVKGALPVFLDDGESIVFSSKSGVSILSDGEVYDIFTDSTGSVFRCDMDVVGDSVIFSAAPSDGLYRLTKTETGEWYCDVSLEGYVIYDFGVSGSCVVFEDGNGSLYCVDIDGGKAFPKVRGTLLSGAFCVDGENVYFYGGSDDGGKGVYRITVDGIRDAKDPEPVIALDKNRYDVSDIHVSGGDILLYYSNGDKTRPYNELVLYRDGAKEGKTVFLNK